MASSGAGAQWKPREVSLRSWAAVLALFDRLSVMRAYLGWELWSTLLCFLRGCDCDAFVGMPR